MLTTMLLIAFCAADQAPPPPHEQAKDQPEKRWRALSQEQRSRLKHVYRLAPRSEWERRAKEWERRGLPPIERFPAHWRSYIVANSLWARRHIEALPPEQRLSADLPPEARVARLKEILRPLFREKLAHCRRAAEQIFTPFELRMLRQLPPSEREKVLRRADHDAFGLVSPSSRRKFEAAGEDARAAREYLLMPDALRSGDFVGRGQWRQGRGQERTPGGKEPRGTAPEHRKGDGRAPPPRDARHEHDAKPGASEPPGA